MNFGEAKANLRRKIGNPTVSQIADSLIGDYINESERQISLDYKFREVRCIKSFKTTIGVDRYILPYDLSYIRQVMDWTNRYRLKGPYADRTMFDLPLRANGRVKRFIREGNWIQLDPPPNAVVTIKFSYVKILQDQTDDNALLRLPLDWHMAVPMYARYMYYSDIQDYPKAQNAWNDFELWASKHPLPIEREMDEKDVEAEFSELGTVRDTSPLDFEHIDD